MGDGPSPKDDLPKRSIVAQELTNQMMNRLISDMLQPDTEWLGNVPDGFEYWPTGHRLTVQVSGDDDGAVWRAQIDVVRDVASLGAAVVMCNALNAETAGWAYVLDFDERTITARSTWVGPAQWEPMWHHWVDAIVLADWHVAKIGPTLARACEGKLDITHPDWQQGPRKVPDEMLQWLTYCRRESARITGTTWLGSRLPAVATLMQSHMGELADDVAVGANGFTITSYEASDPAQPKLPGLAGNPEPQYWVKGSPGICTGIGNGFDARIVFPTPLDPADAVFMAAVANLSLAQSGDTQMGAFSSRRGLLGFRTFVPDFDLARLLAGAATGDELDLRLVSILGFLSAPIPHGLANPSEFEGAGEDLPEPGVDPWEGIYAEAFASMGAGAGDWEGADAGLLWAEDLREPVALWGIFNPHGPTLTRLSRARDPHTGRLRLIRTRRHPLGPEYGASEELSSEEAFSDELHKTIDMTMGDCPDFVLVKEGPGAEDVKAALLEAVARRTTPDELARSTSLLRHYEGRPWDQLADADRVKSRRSATEIRPAQEVLDEWWAAVTDRVNVSGHLQQWTFCWDMAVERVQAGRRAASQRG